MQLKNSKTGKIVKLVDIITKDNRVFFRFEDEFGVFKKEYNSLEDFNEEWEDYEKPKEAWFIYGINPWKVTEDCWNDNFIDEIKTIDNYFESQKEAEKAVEKLKAWKRLKDKGFRFTGYYIPRSTQDIEISASWSNDFCNIMDDLDLLFGGDNI